MKKKIIDIIAIARLIFYLCFLLYFIITPTTLFTTTDVYQFNNPIMSPTAGVTRAFSSLMHGKFVNAYYFNPIFTFAIAPISLFIFFQDISIVLTRLIKKDKKYSIIEYFFVKY
jgi:hypothetical protein